MWSQKSRSYNSISGTIPTSVNVTDAASPQSKVAVKTGLILTYCADRLSVETYRRAFLDGATYAAAVLPETAPQDIGKGYDHDLSLIVDVKGTQPINTQAVTATASRTGHPHVIVAVGNTVFYLYDRVAFDACLAAWTLASQLAAAAFPNETVDSFEQVLATADAGERRRFERSGRPH